MDDDDGIGGDRPSPDRIWPRWVWPHWLERQLDPTSPDYTPAFASAREAATWRELPDGLWYEPANVTGRNWTVLGNLSTSARALVDARGLVTAHFGWSLDWWIGADDRWHFPSRDAAVRQTAVDDMPVVETSMRIPGGDAVHRAYAVRDGASDLIVVEVENRSPVPFALALAIRPYDVTGVGQIEHIGLDEARLVALVDGRPAVRLPKPPSRVAASIGSDGDVVRLVTDGGAGDDLPPALACPDGLAQAAFIFPVPHTASVRVALPIGDGVEPAAGDGGRRRRSPAPAPPPTEVRSLADAERVASGWRTQGDRGLRIDVPDAGLTELVDRARRHLLLVPGGGDLVWVPDQLLDYASANSVFAALDAYGYHDEVDQVLDGWPDRQGGDGWFIGDPTRGDRNGAALAALGRHWQMSGTIGSGEGDDELAYCISRAVRALDKALGRRRGRSPEPQLSWRELAWSVDGWRHAAALLDALDQPDAADLVLESTWPDGVTESPGIETTGAAGAMGARGADAAIDATSSAALGDPLDLGVLDLVGCDPVPVGFAERVEAIRRRPDVDGGVHDAIGPAGLSPVATARLARAELALGLGDPLDPQRRLAWLVDRATPTGTWPAAVHPRTGRGIRGPGHDPLATAEVLLLVRDLLVRETDDGLALAGRWPDEWLGQGVEVHDAPTASGRCSYAVRWHGDRPALLWDLEPGSTTDGDARDAEVAAARRRTVRLTIPGLDPSWSTTEPKGEALLAAPVAKQPSETGGSFA